MVENSGNAGAAVIANSRNSTIVVSSVPTKIAAFFSNFVEPEPCAAGAPGAKQWLPSRWHA